VTQRVTQISSTVVSPNFNVRKFLAVIMSHSMTAEELAQEIAQFLVDPRAIIFAGAGVGVRVGLPTWQQWLTHLATVCRKYKDRLAADLIEERVK
jgi:hypothetical protein